MSLEELIAANTAALETNSKMLAALSAAILAGNLPDVDVAGAVIAGAETKPAAAETKAPSAETKPAAAEPTKLIPFDTVKAEVIRLGAEGKRAEVAALLATFKAARASELDASQYAAFLEKAAKL